MTAGMLARCSRLAHRRSKPLTGFERVRVVPVLRHRSSEALSLATDGWRCGEVVRRAGEATSDGRERPDDH